MKQTGSTLFRKRTSASPCNCTIAKKIVVVLLLFTLAVKPSKTQNHGFNYTDALNKGILFFEGQRSGKLPCDQRMTWRGDSALSDGSESNVSFSIFQLKIPIQAQVFSHYIKQGGALFLIHCFRIKLPFHHAKISDF